MRTRGIRAALAALFVTMGLGLSACGILGNPLAGKAEPSAPASAAASPSPSAPSAPEAGQCHSTNFTYQTSMVDDRVVPCTEDHLAETVFVSRFVGAAAPEQAPVLRENATGAEAAIQNDAYLDCSSHADAYLGHSWIHPQVELRIVLPDDRSWRNGDRWYRCDLYEVEPFTVNLVHRTAGLKTNWFGASCFDLNGYAQARIDCAKKHPNEFVGGFLLPATQKTEPKTTKQFDPYHEKCWKLVGAYAGISTSKASSLTGVWFLWQSDVSYWASGRRAAWCFTWTGEKTSSYVTGSAQGRKGKSL